MVENLSADHLIAWRTCFAFAPEAARTHIADAPVAAGAFDRSAAVVPCTRRVPLRTTAVDRGRAARGRRAGLAHLAPQAPAPAA